MVWPGLRLRFCEPLIDRDGCSVPAGGDAALPLSIFLRIP
jgi:hypothetical protein